MKGQRSPDVDLDALAARLAPLVAARLAAAMTANLATPYSTRKGMGPDGVSDRVWKRVAPTIPGARHCGRWVVVPRAAYEAWATRGTDAAPTVPAANDTSTTTWTPIAALAAAGLRPAAGGRPTG